VNELYSAAELHALTDYARCGQQAAWLAEHGIPHKVDDAALQNETNQTKGGEMMKTNYQLRSRAIPEKLWNIGLNDVTVKRCIDYYISSDITMHEMLVLLVEHLAAEKKVYLKQALGVIATQQPQLVIGAFKAGEAAYVDTEGDLRAAIDAACTVAYADGRKDEAEAVQDEPSLPRPLTAKQIAQALISCADPISMGGVPVALWMDFARAVKLAHGIKEPS
jgi:hypothetical protein